MSLHWAFNPLGINALQAYPGVRGVVIASGSEIKLQNMIVQGGTVASGSLGDHMYVYSNGQALDYAILASGDATVYNGGLASNIHLSSGIITAGFDGKSADQYDLLAGIGAGNLEYEPRSHRHRLRRIIR